MMNSTSRATSAIQLPAADTAVLSELLKEARPILKIKGADRVDWRRVMKKTNDGRNGPWKWHAKFDVLDQQTWKRAGEVLYFVTDEQGTARLVGQSIGRLKTRWKEVPMSTVNDASKMDKRGLFHTTAWPSIETEFDSRPEATYTVSAIFRDELQHLCHRIGGPLAQALEMKETHLERLSYHVETWVCGLKRHGLPLWNKQKT